MCGLSTLIIKLFFRILKKSIPFMEFVRRNYLNSFSGNNGCNQIMGNLKGLTNTDLQFATINETRMACKEMKLSNTFLTLLRETNQYKIAKLNLTLMDSNGKVLLLFKKNRLTNLQSRPNNDIWGFMSVLN